MRLAFLLFLLGCFGTAHAGWFGPKNYDECILENMKGTTQPQAVWAIKDSCRAKFPDKENAKSRALNPWEVAALTGNAGPYLSRSDLFDGNIYNGNKTVTVAQLSIVVTTRVKNKLIPRTYVTDVNIAPQSTGVISFTFIREGEFESWRIDGARGH